MENLTIEATKSSPFLQFLKEEGRMQISGQSYPENAAAFYEPVLAWLRDYFQSPAEKTVLSINIIYLNTSSSKIFINIFDLFEEQHKSGKQVEVQWLYDPENEVSLEWGEEFKEDLSLPFKLVECEE